MLEQDGVYVPKVHISRSFRPLCGISAGYPVRLTAETPKVTCRRCLQMMNPATLRRKARREARIFEQCVLARFGPLMVGKSR